MSEWHGLKELLAITGNGGFKLPKMYNPLETNVLITEGAAEAARPSEASDP